MLTYYRPTLSLTGFAVGSIEYSLCNIRHLRNLPISNPRIYSLAIADTFSDRVCRWVDRLVPSAALFSVLTSESVFIHMLSCRRPDTVSDRF